MITKLSRHGLAEPHLYVMDTIRLHVPLHRTTMVDWLLRYYAGGDLTRLVPSANEFETAIVELLQREIIQIVAESDKSRPPPAYSTFDRCPSAGTLDWTPKGNLLAKEIFGDELVEPAH